MRDEVVFSIRVPGKQVALARLLQVRRPLRAYPEATLHPDPNDHNAATSPIHRVSCLPGTDPNTLNPNPNDHNRALMYVRLGHVDNMSCVTSTAG